MINTTTILFDRLLQRDYTIETTGFDITQSEYYGTYPDTMVLIYEAVHDALLAWRELYAIPPERIGRELVVKSITNMDNGDIIYLDTSFDWN
jgi:hypothetical protein